MQQEQTIELGGGRSLHAVTRGTGPDVVLIHGLLSTSHDWIAGPFARIAAEGFRVTPIDRPGHGRSRRPRLVGTPRGQAEQVRDALIETGIERPVLVGHSFGGLVSLACAERYPDFVAALVLVAPVAFPEARPLEHTMLAPRSVPFLGPLWSVAADATIDPPMLKAVQRLMFSPQEVPEAWEASFPYDQVLDPTAMVFEGEDAASILPMSPAGTIDVARIEAPVQILTGTSDKIVEDERQAKQLARLLPNSRLIKASGIGHMLHHARPDLVITAVREAAASA